MLPTRYLPELGRRSAFSALMVAVAAATALADTTYHVRIAPGSQVGAAVRLVMDLVSDRTMPDSMVITNFAHNGKRGAVLDPDELLFEGGPLHGDLLGTANPAARTVVEGSAFLNSIAIPFDSLGSSVSFALTVPQAGASALGIADQVAMFMYRRDGSYLFSTADPLGAQALFALGVTSDAGGDLSVFSPMTFIAPDTLSLNLTGVDVQRPTSVGQRLQFRTAAPNPSAGNVEIVMEVPSPGGALRLRVYDVLGRLVAEPFHKTVEPGALVVQWDGRRSAGGRAAAGVYLLCADFTGQTVVRRLVLVR
jgi:FlgD Ig-like domain